MSWSWCQVIPDLVAGYLVHLVHGPRYLVRGPQLVAVARRPGGRAGQARRARTWWPCLHVRPGGRPGVCMSRANRPAAGGGGRRPGNRAPGAVARRPPTWCTWCAHLVAARLVPWPVGRVPPTRCHGPPTRWPGPRPARPGAQVRAHYPGPKKRPASRAARALARFRTVCAAQNSFRPPWKRAPCFRETISLAIFLQSKHNRFHENNLLKVRAGQRPVAPAVLPRVPRRSCQGPPPTARGPD